MANNKTLSPRKKKEWLELCAWVELNIFEYEPTQKLQTRACLTLDGLRKGQAFANNKNDTYGEYPLEVILLAFKANKTMILNAIKGKTFETEDKKMRYVCSIIRDRLNDIYTRYLNAQKTQKKAENVDTSIMTYQGAEYQSSTQNDEKKKQNSKFDDLW